MKRFYVITGEQWDALNHAIAIAQVYAPERSHEAASAGRAALSAAKFVSQASLSKGVEKYVAAGAETIIENPSILKVSLAGGAA